MGSIIALLTIILVAWFVVRLGTSALELTGMSRAISRFQSASAFFGVGFTTKEAEQVVNHPVRRKIILHLIIAGNIGLTSALATLLVTFRSGEDRGWGTTFAWLGAVVVLVIVLGSLLNLNFVSIPLERLMKWSLKRAGMTRLSNYDHLLNLADGYCLEDYEVMEGHAWIGKNLAELRPADLGVIVLGVHRSDGKFIGAPTKDTVVKVEDVLLIYGNAENLKKNLARS